jgi:hypothetical protein
VLFKGLFPLTPLENAATLVSWERLKVVLEKSRDSWSDYKIVVLGKRVIVRLPRLCTWPWLTVSDIKEFGGISGMLTEQLS